MAACGLQLDVGVVGVDLKVVVQGRELVSLQLLDATLALALAPDPPPPLESNTVSLGLRIVDISIRDLQVRAPHPTASNSQARGSLTAVIEWVLGGNGVDGSGG